MPDSVERTNELLLQAKKNTEEARTALAETERQYEQIDDIHLNTDVSLQKTHAVLDTINANVQRMAEQRQAMSRLIESIKNIQEGVRSIYNLEHRFEAFLKHISLLDETGNYDEALAKVDELEALSTANDFGEQLALQRVLSEITPWTRVSLIVHKGEAFIDANEAPMSNEELEAFANSVEELPIGIHPELAQEEMRDRIRGWRCVIRAKEEAASEPSLESLKTTLALLEAVRADEKSFSELTKARVTYLYNIAIDEYNILSAKAFDEGNDYEVVLEYFNLRGYFLASRVKHDAYRESEDEADFKLRFHKAMLLRLSPEEFDAACKGYAANISDEESFEFILLAELLVMADLPEEKLNLLYQIYHELPFQTAILLTAGALQRGCPEERKAHLVEDLLARKHKELDLEKCAKALLVCKENFTDSLQKRFEILLKDLLRSPHAHKVCVKSPLPEVHALYGETPETMRAPIGKPLGKPLIKAWDFLLKGLYQWMGIIVPLILCAAAGVAIFFIVPGEDLRQYILTAPLVVGLVIAHFAICARFGRDERGSAVYRRCLGITALIFAAASLVYFALPTFVPFLQPYAYALILYGAVLGFWGLFFYKDKVKKVSIPIYVAWYLCEVASLVFLILMLMKG